MHRHGMRFHAYARGLAVARHLQFRRYTRVARVQPQFHGDSHCPSLRLACVSWPSFGSAARLGNRESTATGHCAGTVGFAKQSEQPEVRSSRPTNQSQALPVLLDGSEQLSVAQDKNKSNRKSFGPVVQHLSGSLHPEACHRGLID